MKDTKMITAELKNYRQSPRKVRLVADLIKGKQVDEALDLLQFTTKRASDPVTKLLKSAIANASHNFNIKSTENLYIKDMRVDEGVTLQRWRPRARGAAYPIRKRTSHVKITLEDKK
jgi:large subunit ribosomal protein L22